MILFLAISGSTGAPCQCDHPWVLLLVALSPPGRSLWFGAIPKGARMALKLLGGDFPWAGERSNQSWMVLN